MTKSHLLHYGIVFIAGVAAGAALGSMAARRSFTRIAGIFLGGFIFAVLFLGYIFYIEPNWTEVNRVVIHDSALAKSLEGVKIVQVSDFHLRNGLGFREHDLIQKVNSLKPDLIFMTGDYIDSMSQMKYGLEILKSFKAKIGIWGIPGNTDSISINGTDLAKAFQKTGARFLVNEAERIQTGAEKYLWLVGVDETVYGHANLKQALGDVPPGQPTLLLAHSPDIFEEAVRNNINLVLVGHTHGGQVGIPFLIRLSDYANRTPYMRGLFKKGSTQLYVNRGIGMKTRYFRFLCRPEITLLEVKP